MTKLYDINKIITYTDGENIYNEIKKEYNTFKKGYFIYGPSGVGKSYYINNQKENNWIDQDYLCTKNNCFPSGAWWEGDDDTLDMIEKRMDIITDEYKRLGFRIIGASSYDLVPDAIVIPPLDTHLEYIKLREENNYDTGLKLKDMDKIKETRKYFTRYNKEDGIPIFESVDDAVSYLESLKDN